MGRLRTFAIACLALLLAACASTPPPPPSPFVVELAPTPPVGADASLALQPMRIDDMRDVADPARIGEVHAPAFVGPVAPGPEGAMVTTGLLLVGLAVPAPTGRYVTVADPAHVGRAVERALTFALFAARRAPVDAGMLGVTVRRFWMRPWWTTTCDIVLDARVLTPFGETIWQRTLESHVGKFEGWFTVEAFERVATLGLDDLVVKASEAFASTEFGAAIAAGR